MHYTRTRHTGVNCREQRPQGLPGMGPVPSRRMRQTGPSMSAHTALHKAPPGVRDFGRVSGGLYPYTLGDNSCEQKVGGEGPIQGMVLLKDVSGDLSEPESMGLPTSPR